MFIDTLLSGLLWLHTIRICEIEFSKKNINISIPKYLLLVTVMRLCTLSDELRQLSLWSQSHNATDKSHVQSARFQALAIECWDGLSS